MPRWALRSVQTLATLALLVLLWRVADGPLALRALADAQWHWLGAAALALTGQTILSALRWQLAARQLGVALGTGHAIAEYYLGLVVNQALPGGMLGDAARAVRARGQAGLLASGQAVVFERLAGQVVIFALLGVSFVATLAVPGGLEWPIWLIGPVAGLLLAALCAPLVFWAASALPGPVGPGVVQQARALYAALWAPAVRWRQLALSFVTTGCNLAAFAFCARAVGAPLSLIETCALVPLILVTMMIPLSISGWGLREGAAAMVLPVAGVPVSAAFAASIAFGLMFLVSVLPGLLLAVARPRGVAPVQPKTRADASASVTPGSHPALPPG